MGVFVESHASMITLPCVYIVRSAVYCPPTRPARGPVPPRAGGGPRPGRRRHLHGVSHGHAQAGPENAVRPQQ